MNAKIYIDGDACPVKAEVLKVAERHHLPVFLVANTWMRGGRSELLKRIVVEEGPDAADDWIAEHIGAGDICITSDIPLAARCLEKGGSVIKPNGEMFTDNNIGAALASRELMQHIRETGGQTFNASFTARDRSKFLQVLENEVQRISRAK